MRKNFLPVVGAFINASLTMKCFRYPLLNVKLKTILTLLVICSLCFLALAMKAKKTVDDIWQQLGITLPDAQKNINNSFFDGKLYYFGAKNAKNLALGNRVAVVNSIVAYAKNYINSAEFKNTWQEYQNKRSEVIRRSLPRKPEAKTIESIKADEKLLLEKRLTAVEANLNSPNENVKKGATVQAANIKKEIQALDDPANTAVKRKFDMANRNYEYQLKLYNDAMQNFEAKYPSNPKLVLKQRLQDILNITADVDYAAELKDGDKGKKIFVNPEYERKPTEWKLAFRSGKAATDAVRAAAQQWLNELD
jgi:hypothetical protein